MEADVTIDRSLEEVPLPASWPHRVRSSILRVMSLTNLAIIYSRSWAANSSNSRVRLQGKLEHARSDISLLTEELRIKAVRMAVRPSYSSGLPAIVLQKPTEPFTTVYWSIDVVRFG
jgi:hypothetical protein